MEHKDDAYKRMDKAAEIAEEQLTTILEAMKTGERSGATAIINWLKGNYKAAGYKRASKILLKLG